MVLERVAETPQKALPYPRDNGVSKSWESPFLLSSQH